MQTPYVRKAEIKDALVLAKTMRKQDREEIYASNNVSPLEALVIPFTIENARTYSVVGVGDEGVICMFGCTPTEDVEYGCAWLLGSEVLLKHRKQWLKESRYWTTTVGQDYKYLYNFVDRRNWVSLKWLQYLGFEVKEEFPEYGHTKIPFLLMMKEMKK